MRKAYNKSIYLKTICFESFYVHVTSLYLIQNKVNIEELINRR